jgi:hypothetical protein
MVQAVPAPPADPPFWKGMWPDDAKAQHTENAEPIQAPAATPVAPSDLATGGEVVASTDKEVARRLPATQHVAEAAKSKKAMPARVANADAEVNAFQSADNAMQAGPPPAAMAQAKILSSQPALMGLSMNHASVRGAGASMGAGYGGVGSVAAAPAKPVERPGLGTEYGAAESSHAGQAPFERAGTRPVALLSVHYDNYEGLEELGIDVDGRLEASREARRRQGAQPFRRDQTFQQSPSTLAK